MWGKAAPQTQHFLLLFWSDFFLCHRKIVRISFQAALIHIYLV